MTMRERLARRYWVETRWPSDVDWEHLSEGLKGECFEVADGMLEELREPTPQMVGLMCGYSDFTFTPGVIETRERYEEEVRMMWRVGVDVAACKKIS